MTEQAPDRLWSGIDVSKTIAGALAAVCAAVVGSFLGVAGTLVGAAVASIIGSVGTEIWARSLKRGQQKLQQTVAPAFIKAPAAVGTPEVAAATEDESPSHTVPPAPRHQIRWKRVWLIAGAVFVLAMGTLTVFELISGKSLASAVGNSTGATSTVGGLLHPGTSGKSTTPAVTTSPTPTVAPTTGSGDSGTTSTEAPATTAPTSPDGGGSDQGATSGPTMPATTEAPVQSPPAADSGQDQQGQGGGDPTP
jgi:hypothetical protein